MMRQVSIRWRLTLWYSGVLAVVLLAFGAAIYVTLRHQLLERIDDGLHEEMADVVGEVERASDRESLLGWLNRRFAHHEGFDFQITDSEGDRVFANPRLGERRLPQVASTKTKTEATFVTAELSDEGRWRIISRTVRGPDGVLRVQVARWLASYDHEMAELLAALLITGPMTLLAALAGGYFLARRALRPVDEMTDAANRITAKQLDKRLTVANPNDELGRLAGTLNNMLERLERSFREMQRFTADASHELRTPLAVVRTEAEVALARPVSETEKQNLLSNILEECERLTWITDQLLTLSREDAGVIPMKRQPVDISSLSRAVAETMRPLAEAKQQRLVTHLNGECNVSGDADRLRHVVYNLLDNAIKYTPEGGEVAIAVARNGSKVRLEVRDTGIGIREEHLPHVFERFYRVDKARSRSAGGSGLGLSIVESIVTAHGGRVEIDSRPDAGTSIIVSLPMTVNQSD